MEEKKLPPLPKNSQPAVPPSTSKQKGKKASKQEWYSINLGGGFWQREREVLLGGLFGLVFVLGFVIWHYNKDAPAPKEDAYKDTSIRDAFRKPWEGFADPLGGLRGSTTEKKNLEELKKLNREVKSLKDKLEGK